MNGRSMGMLMMAVLCGLGAMYATTRLISNDRNAPVVEMQDVIVATRDIKVEELVKPDLVKVIRLPKTSVPAGAYSSAKDVEDRWVTIGILAGEPILDKKLAVRGMPPGLTTRIPVGMRAFTVEVNEHTGVSGFVLPDHRVDVVRMETGKQGQAEAETVLQDVLVLASGQVYTKPDDRTIPSRAVTLAVTPEQVDTLVAARAHGTLALSLRGLNDHAQVAHKEKPAPVAPPVVKDEPTPRPQEEPVVVAKVEEPPPPPAPVVPRPKAPRTVALYRGLEPMRRIRVDVPADLVESDLAPADESLASASTVPSAAGGTAVP